MKKLGQTSRIYTIRTTSAVLALLVLALAIPAQAALISRTILVDGLFLDWILPSNILDNSEQTSADAAGNASTGSTADLDWVVQSTGRDLKSFAYTWDNTNLYFYVSRYGSSQNTNLWWFYLDLNANGLMETGEKAFSVEWAGNNRHTKAVLYTYTAASPGGDSLVCLSSCVAGGVGLADGHTMPGTIDKDTGGTVIYDKTVFGGSADGIQMEARLPWSAISLSGPKPMGFHISASNSTNIPGQIDDNMEGTNGNFMFFIEADLAVTKAAVAIADGSPITTAVGGSQFNYVITVTNTDPSTAVDGISIDDTLPAGVTFSSALASQGSYNPAIDNTWDIGALAAGATATLTITVTVDDPPNAGTPENSIVVTNTADNLKLLALDTNSSNNQAEVDVTLQPVPVLSLSKTSVVIDDGLTGDEEFHVPGAVVEYTVVVENTSSFIGADSVMLSDVLPAETTYEAGTLTVEGAPLTDASDSGAPGGDDGEVTSGTVLVNLGTVAISSTTTVKFQVKIN